MIYNTIGREYHTGYCHPIRYIPSFEISDPSEEACFRLLLLEQGTCTLNYMGGPSYHVAAPALIGLNDTDKAFLTESRDLIAAAINFHPGIINPIFDFHNIRVDNNLFFGVQLQDLFLLNPFLQRDSQFNGAFEVEEDTFARIRKLAELMGRELIAQKDLAWPCRSRSYFLEILILITKIYESRQETAQPAYTEATPEIAEILTYLHNNYQSKITLEQLSVMFATNRTTLNSHFYKATNLSVIDYLINLRIHVAKTLLRDTRLPISEIIVRVGFNNSTHFWRTFKKYNSISPKEYRDQYCWVKG